MTAIVILALVALFIGLRLYNVLGERTGHEQRRSPSPPRPMARRFAPRPEASGRCRAVGTDPDDLAYLPTAGPGVRALLAADSSFDVARFLEGAKAAYRLILESFWKGDLEAMRAHVDDHVHDAFAAAVDQRSKDGLILDNRLVAIEQAVIAGAELDRKIALVTVRFEADIAAVTRDADGEVVAGSLTDAVQTRDRWTFRRDIGATRSQLAAGRDRRGMSYRTNSALAAGLLLAGCATRTPPPSPASVPAAPPVRRCSAVPWTGQCPMRARRACASRRQRRSIAIQAARALAAFRISCPALLKRTDASALTQRADWQGLCAEAATADPPRAAASSATASTGSRWAAAPPSPPAITSPRSGFADCGAGLCDADLSHARRPHSLHPRRRRHRARAARSRAAPASFISTAPRSRMERLPGAAWKSPWPPTRSNCSSSKSRARGGSVLPDGSVMRIGYDNQNGREYTAIGRLLRERGVLPPGGATMKSIVAWIRAHPAEGAALMRENMSYIFFKELTGPGPLGALGAAGHAARHGRRRSQFRAARRAVFLDVDRAEADGLWVAQDTGGAIKGANRFDTFWGAGAAAEATAGGMSATGGP